MWILLALPAVAEPSLSGTYVLDEAEATLLATHAAAIEQASSQLPWAFRPLAYGPLQKAVKSCARLELALDPSTFRMRCDEEPPIAHDRSAPVGSITSDAGDPVEVRFAPTEASATISFVTEDGGQRITYTPEGEALVVRKELFSARLPTPVAWTVRYRRQP